MPASPLVVPGRARNLDDACLDKLDLGNSIPFLLAHAVAFAAPFVVGISWKLVGLAVLFYYLRMAATTIGYHRYFSHRTFKTSRVFQFLLAFAAETSAQKGALWWAAHHRDHHRYSDMEGDIHSPKKGFWWSHVLWILCRRYAATDESKIKDFAKYPELRWLNKYHLVPPVLLAVALFLAGGTPALLWGFFVSTVLLWHGTFLVNSLNHVWGTRRYATTDTSRNNAFIALFTMGEGWHNNHHHFMSSANQGFFWWELDASYYLIRAFEALGLVWDVRTPPARILADTIQSRGEAPALGAAQDRAAA
jgi:stearoyl-CoA desaturase (delta-9 desaturase)